MYLVLDHLRLNYGYQKTKSSNRRKQKKTEKFIKFLTKSLRALEIWELAHRHNQDRPTKEVNHSHKVLVSQEPMDNNINNNTKDKEVVDI
jgi:hypothetical protein